jgi:Zn-dependent protease with chaperone function
MTTSADRHRRGRRVAGHPAAGLAASTTGALRAAAGSRALRAWIRAARRLVPAFMQNEAAALGCAARLYVVAGEDAFAVTCGLIRPRMLVSTGLAAALTPAEVRAVLAHERAHLRARDPLRLLAARLFVAWGCYLPARGPGAGLVTESDIELGRL